MAFGIRTGSAPFPFTPQADPQAYALYDPELRRAVTHVEQVVPTLNLGDSNRAASYLADRWYSYIGAQALAGFPVWLTSGGNPSFKNWDATDQRFYARFSSDASNSSLSGFNLGDALYYGGFKGLATSHAPKNSSVSRGYLEFRARFIAAADYTVYGIGATNSSFNATSHFVQALRITGTWALKTCNANGSTIGTVTGGTADSNFHDFAIELQSAQVSLYVDGALACRATTLLPARPMVLVLSGNNSTQAIDIVDIGIRWE